MCYWFKSSDDTAISSYVCQTAHCVLAGRGASYDLDSLEWMSTLLTGSVGLEHYLASYYALFSLTLTGEACCVG